VVGIALATGASAHTVAPASPHWLGLDYGLDLRVHYPINNPTYRCNAYNGNSQTGWCNNVAQEAGNYWTTSSDWKPIRIEPTGTIAVLADNYGNSGWYGATNFSYSTTTGHMSGVYIQLNPSLLNNPHPGSGGVGDTTLQKRCVAAHEWGHAAGLRHHVSTTGSIMYEPGDGTGHGWTCHTQGMTGAQLHDRVDVNEVHQEPS
jgi:hypothetical protein